MTTAPALRARAASSPHWWRWLLLAAAVIALDLATKAMIVARFQVGEALPVTSFMSLVLAYNTGAAFSFLAGADGWQRWLFAAIALVASGVMIYLIRRGGSRTLMLGLALILGGALGNLYDRIVLGHVTDFLLFHYRGWSWPAFNVADSAITVGAGLLILDSFRKPAARGAAS
ncbi:MAG: signal peptidase II [Burkholderiales bacterium]